MQRMKLTLADLEVDSFESGSDRRTAGTIFGYDDITTAISNIPGAVCVSCYGCGGGVTEPDPEHCRPTEE